MAMAAAGDPPRIDIPGDERPTLSAEDSRRSRQLLAWAIAALIVALIAVGSFLALSSGTHTQVARSTEDLPVIRADVRPFKVSPEEPGGMEVPNRDKLVYSRLKGVAGGAPAVERLLPEAESPLPPPTAPVTAAPTAPPALSVDAHAKPDTVASAAPTTAPPLPAAAAPPVGKPEATLPPETGTAPATTAPPPAVAPRPLARPGAKAEPAAVAEKSSETKVAALPKADAPIPPVATKTPAGKPVFQVQLGAMSSAETAKAQWQKLMSANRDLIGQLQPSVAQADLGDKRVYRLRAGPLGGPEKAQALCKALASRGVGCVVVSAGG